MSDFLFEFYGACIIARSTVANLSIHSCLDFLIKLITIWLAQFLNFIFNSAFCYFNFISCRYVRALGAFYMRLVGTALECYKYLEPLYNDYRKMKKKDKATGSMIFFLRKSAVRYGLQVFCFGINVACA